MKGYATFSKAPYHQMQFSVLLRTLVGVCFFTSLQRCSQFILQFQSTGLETYYFEPLFTFGSWVATEWSVNLWSESRSDIISVFTFTNLHMLRLSNFWIFLQEALLSIIIPHSAGAVRYTDCISTKGVTTLELLSWMWHKIIWLWGFSNAGLVGIVE